MRRILIIGFEPIGRKAGLRQLAIPGRFELWTFNGDHQLMRFSRRHFEMHELGVYGANAVDDVSPDDNYLRKLRSGIGVPVYALTQTVEIAGSVAYPIVPITKRFGTYLTNSVSYMLALAIYEAVDEIHIYGVDMAREHEHGWERPSIEYLIGWARGAGIKVVVPETSDLLKCLGLYGYIDAYEIEAASRERLEDLRAQIRSYERQAAALSGAADDTEYWMRRMLLPGDGGTSKKARARKKWLMEHAARYRKAVEAA